MSDEDAAVSSDGETSYSVGRYELRTVLDYVALAGLVLFALIAAVQLYTAVGSIINQWIAREYQVIFNGLFNLVVLLLCVGGISMQLERLN